jgi:hypothetical protein
VRDRKVDQDESFEVYRIHLRKNIDVRVRKKPLMVNMEVQEVGEVIARFNVFTSPLSVFIESDILTVSPCYEEKLEHVYVLICNPQFGLLFFVDISSLKRENMAIDFEQIVTIKHAKELVKINKT